jgi:O-antigen/teichoic acid export membrane protein
LAVASIRRSAGLLAVGTASGQGAVLLATPWIARVYTPEDFGRLALMLTVSNIATALACLRYDLALPAARDELARPLRNVAMLATLACALLMGVGIVAWQAAAPGPLPSPLDQAGLIALCVLLVGWQQASVGWFIRLGAFSRVALMRVTQGVGFVALALLPGAGLAWAHALSFGLGLTSLIGLKARPAANEARLWAAAKQERSFPLVGLPGAALDVVGYSLCIWLITVAYGVEGAGEYSQIQRLLGAPIMLLATSLGQVLLRHTAELRHDGAALRHTSRRVLRNLGGAALLLVVAVGFIGEPVLKALLGDQWRVDTGFVLPIAAAVAVRACVSPLSTLLITLRRFDLGLCWQAGYFVSAIIVLGFGSRMLSLSEFVWLYCAHELVQYAIYYLLIQHGIRKSCAASSN